ncbi:pectate lyase superfamily protein-domain-containing protein, partial [Immersiella caudata]
MPVSRGRQTLLVAVFLLLANFGIFVQGATAATSFSAKFLAAADASPADTDGSAPLLAKATVADIERARKIVREAQEKARVLNRARFEHPRRNQYKLKPGTVINGKPTVQRRNEDDVGDADGPPPPLLRLTEEMSAAAALVAEADAAAKFGNATSHGPIQKRAAYWMEGLARKGTMPWGGDSKYQVFRNVKDFGARGDGKTDDTKAIMNAMSAGSRCGEKCNGSTVKNAIVYFPQGTYLVSEPIYVLFGTQMIGDANSWPTIKGSSAFSGLGVVSTDEYVQDGGKGIDGLAMEWYVNTANFYRQIRNFYIDITETPVDEGVAAIHYQIAQATSLQNVEIIAKPGTDQQGMYSENGSGGVISDVTFRGGKFGFWGGNQQFTAQRLTFIGCDTAVKIIWDWGWVWKTITVRDSPIGFDIARARGQGYIGSATFLDSTFQNVKQAIIVTPPSSEPGKGATGLVLENVSFKNCDKAVADGTGNRLLASGDYEHWVIGPVYSGDKGAREYSSGKSYRLKRSTDLLDSRTNGLPFKPYYERAKPQYEGKTASDFVHIKDYGAKGDGVTDDTAAVQKAFDDNPNGVKVVFVDSGTYILTDTVTVPKNAKVVGEAWSQFAARGPKFANASEPRVMFKVGKENDHGTVELQDLLFTTKGATPGAVLVEWNVNAVERGLAGLWDCHVRIGGATGTDLNPADCPALVDTPSPKCQAASMMMHITPKASGYFENMWLWVADHMIDDPDLNDANNTMTQVSVYVARGLLVESREAVWLYGTSSEHATLYQYNFNRASKVFAGMVQTESPYYQPQPKAPAPFGDTMGMFPGDPYYDSCTDPDATSNSTEFNGCDSSWGVMIQGSSDIYVASAGIYSWFDKYKQDCIGKHECQKALVYLDGNYDGVRIQHLVTIGAKYMVVQDGKGVLAIDNLVTTAHPRWSHVSIFDASSLG